MYNKILHPCRTTQTESIDETSLVLSQLSILTDSESRDGSGTSLNLSNDYYCTNSDRADICSQSNATSSQHSNACNTPTNSDDDT